MPAFLASLTPADRDYFQERGLSLDEVQRQWALLTQQPKRIVLERPCTRGDGIQQLPEKDHGDLVAAHRAAAAQGRWQKFVPASGAASRMFALHAPADQQRFCQHLERFAFAQQLQEQLARQGIDLHGLLRGRRFDDLLHAIVSPQGLHYAQVPKGLLEFHAYPNAPRTAFEEHLWETAAALENSHGAIRAHFTVAADSREAFVAHGQKFQEGFEGTACDVEFSIQQSATDTIAMSTASELLRDEHGQPILRPGGHGALIENLRAIQGDLIFVKNIDNIAHAHARAASTAWMQILGGSVVRLREAMDQHIRALQSHDARALAAALDFLQQTFPNATPTGIAKGPQLRETLLARLERPLRVCGMVRNEGEPGGGPFRVQEKDGSVSPQIVEAAELDAEDAQQQDIFSQATHFNPVFMALAVRNQRDEPFDLANFVRHDRIITTTKQVAGQTATVLERPGLWNGGMAAWNSLFVEVPSAVFSPVKSVLDLLRPEHQPSHG